MWRCDPATPLPPPPHTQQVVEPLINLDVANRVKAKTARCVYTAHELVSAQTDADKVRRAALKASQPQRLPTVYRRQHRYAYSRSGVEDVQ